MKLRFSPLAGDDIEAADRWWLLNRPAAPTLFEDELGIALALIEAHPRAGSRVDGLDPALGEVRRIVLGATRFLLFYRVEVDTLQILRVYQSNRGDRPRL